MLILVAFDLTRAMGMPADIVWICDDTDDGLAELQKRAFAPWGNSGHVPAECEVVEIWRLQPASGWDEQMVRMCRLQRGGWDYYC